jgi:hypothetical protein
MHTQSQLRITPVLRLFLGTLASLAVVVLPSDAPADSTFSYGDVAWHTYRLGGTWYMASVSDTFQVRAGRVTAVFDTAMTSAGIQSVIHEVPGLSVLRHTHFNTYDFEFSPDEDPGWYAMALSLQPGVVAAVPDAFCVVLDATPYDWYFGDQWAFHNTGQSGGTADADIDALEAWDTETGDTTVVIAVIDAGFHLDHPDWDKSLWTNWAEAAGTDSVDDDGNGFVDDIHGYDFYNDDGDPNVNPWETGLNRPGFSGDSVM